MLLNTCIFISVICWIITSILLAAVLGAMFSPNKEKLISRSIISCLFLVPSLAVVPLSFAAFIILCIISFIVLISIFGIRMAVELIRDGVPEMDEDGNLIQDKIKPTAPWV
tara:strand:- start:44 stop:376 length:333 start_codon:yes stop_codon:yes gene_type:complete